MIVRMTPNPYARIVLDVSALTKAGVSAELQTKTLRTAIHAGVIWVYCPDAASQSLAGRALFDLTRWRAIAPLAAGDGLDALYATSLRLRRNRIDLIQLSNAEGKAARIVRDASRDGIAEGALIDVGDGAEFISALRYPSIAGVMFKPNFDTSSWRDPSVPAQILAKRGLYAYARREQAHAPGVTGTIHEADGPRALFRLFREYRPRRPTPQPGLAEAA